MSASLGMPTAVPCALSFAFGHEAWSWSRMGVRARKTASDSFCAPYPTPSIKTTRTGPSTPGNSGLFSSCQDVMRPDLAPDGEAGLLTAFQLLAVLGQGHEAGQEIGEI